MLETLIVTYVSQLISVAYAGFFITYLFINYFKYFLYRILPAKESIYFLVNCYHCVGFWSSLLVILLMWLFGFRIDYNVFVVILSWLSILYALKTSILFKNFGLLFKFSIFILFVAITISNSFLLYTILVLPTALAYIILGFKLFFEPDG